MYLCNTHVFVVLSTCWISLVEEATPNVHFRLRSERTFHLADEIETWRNRLIKLTRPNPNPKQRKQKTPSFKRNHAVFLNKSKNT